MIPMNILRLGLNSPSISGVGDVMLTLAWAFGTMPRNVKLATITRHLFMLFGANATCVATGLRSGRILKYVVEYGARQKVEDWNPEENGGYAVHENDPSKNAPLDPLQSLEKSTTQEENYQKHSRPHLEQLQDLSAARSADPYSLSVKLRKSFRQGKHAALKIKAEDDALKDKYGLDAGIKLVDKDDPSLALEAKAEWEDGQKRREEEEAKRRLYNAQSGPVEFQTRTGSSLSSAAGSSSAVAGSSRVTIQSPPRKNNSVPRPMHKVHAQPHTSNPILKKDKIAQVAKAKAMSTLTSTLISNSARKADPFARGGIGAIGRSSNKHPGLSRKL
ncbi:unnamed protein product [Rhizoctonia solani]|uniref:Uncharacterized protein n=1 Tax=Rhizoctonia solani TaxID=456999 RepID=A0A8H7M4B2_9AGAM|nr:hypothetical protein RHS04_09547 [Rhizoctonia solani]KAF8754053.1 hypothetical protein RHS01_06333 [Rhizoctonia solani]CAE6443149.1 unnamed protein product [Rhizoctonia solani]